MVIPRRSKNSSFAWAVMSEPRGSIMRRCAASMASRAASRMLSRWRRSRRCRCGFFPGRASRKNVPPAPWHAWHAWTGAAAASRAGRRRAPLYAIDATRHKFRQQPETPPSRAALRKAPRDRFGSACASSSLGPWSDDPSASVGGGERTLASAGDQGSSTTGSSGRDFPFASEGASRVQQ